MKSAERQGAAMKPSEQKVFSQMPDREIPTGGAPVLEIRDLSISYRGLEGDTKAVESVDLSLHRGEVVGLAGESGSGKSTLAYGACRLLRPPAVITAGSVVYRGRRVGPEGVQVLEQRPKQLRALRWREIAIVFQSAMNDVIAAHLPIDESERNERAGSLLDLVGIPRDRLGSYPHELSGGMRQRVMIAMALAVDPEIVIMDEPTTALDVVVQREILSQIVELKARFGFAILFITHDLSLLLELADRIAIMYAGQIMEVASAEDLRLYPAHPYTNGLLNSFPSLRGPRRELTGISGSPPDLRSLPKGCPFAPRCPHVRDACRDIEMRLVAVEGASDATHVSACPFVSPKAPSLAKSATP
jgi:peptide/nickel transport system ATP-binding protein